MKPDIFEVSGTNALHGSTKEQHGTCREGIVGVYGTKNEGLRRLPPVSVLLIDHFEIYLVADKWVWQLLSESRTTSN
ncbi:hypothetical protein PC116_g27131 [Phytophthora cactorum]|uniref:Uncharacterized protein n=1 Tax=Phytophthora cactorum TaxID=29920 RepID=A0A8T1ADL6_9STRA|nr:hypothetical protein Pcac1_g18906 [Phytophthora cactorum]KAG2874051.1 hypothetical protein PC114_g25510 [Phytophthora cactorum]KAG2879850.1 hypothetical protein PC115_g22693 [Phytophthora cactorum]KAG2886980.1 hypothetical protein PC117_g25272 [Phytophthora cactorum]KAG2959825.1 hypothetical protein PC118_g22821 [Phytophthora cactorum]